MFTTKNPTHCPVCNSNDIFLEPREYKKDENGKKTNVVRLGVWYCNQCGKMIGRRMSELENDIDSKSL